ncbi:UNVERIFIED_CONTAM: hypothetical protein NY100_27725, partial [Prevotella sp. 15_C9]
LQLDAYRTKHCEQEASACIALACRGHRRPSGRLTQAQLRGRALLLLRHLSVLTGSHPMKLSLAT